MDALSTIEFIDLTGVEEKEKNWIRKSLREWDPKVQVPWKKMQLPSETTFPVENSLANLQPSHVPIYNGSPDLVLTPNVNLIQQHNIYQSYPIPCYLPAIASNGPLPYTGYQPVAFEHSPTYIPPPQPVASLLIQNNVNYGYGSHTSNYTSPAVVIASENSVPLNFVSMDEPFQVIENEMETVEDGVVQNGILTMINSEDNVEETTEIKSATKSWASLFGSKKSETNCVNGDVNKVNEVILNVEKTVINNDIGENMDNEMKFRYDDPIYHQLGEYLADHNTDHKTISLQPRGLINRSNYCYINSILQALLACPPVYNLLSGMAGTMGSNTKKTEVPIIDNMVKFVKEFKHLPAAHRVSRRIDKHAKQDPNSLYNFDTPFEPSYMYKMLNGLRTDTFVIEGRQEDAEEFLGCLLNGLNDEMLELMKLVGRQRTKSVAELDIDGGNEDKEWQEMGPRNKGSVTRRFQVVQTPLSDVFGGHLRSRLHRTGDKSTDNIQPFYTLQLNIENVTNVKDALDAFVSRNQLEGVTSSKTNEEVEAWQQVTIEQLPYVLVLHLQCFDYQLSGCRKIIKQLDFPIDLKIDSKLLSSKANYSSKEKQYKLFSVVYHDGKEASKGHYLTDAYHVGYSRWMRYDDATVKPVPEEQVLKPHGFRVPYLLFYRRSDSIRNK